MKFWKCFVASLLLTLPTYANADRFTTAISSAQTSNGGYVVAWVDQLDTYPANQFSLNEETVHIEVFDDNHQLIDSAQYQTNETIYPAFRNIDVVANGSDIIIAWGSNGVHLVKYNTETNLSSDVISISDSGYQVDLDIDSNGLVGVVWWQRVSVIDVINGDYENQIQLQLLDSSSLSLVGSRKKVDANNYFSNYSEIVYQKPHISFLNNNLFAVVWGNELNDGLGDVSYENGVFYQTYVEVSGDYEKLAFNNIGFNDQLHAYDEPVLNWHNNRLYIAFNAYSYDLNDEGIYLAEITTEGNLLSSLIAVEQEIPDTTSDGSYFPSLPNILVDSSNRVIMTWAGSVSGLFAKYYDQNLNAMSDYISVSGYEIYDSLISGNDLIVFESENPYVKSIYDLDQLENQSNTNTSNGSGGGGGGSLFPGFLLSLFACFIWLRKNRVR